MSEKKRDGVMLSDGSIWWIVEETDKTITIVPYQDTKGTQGMVAYLWISDCTATNATYEVTNYDPS